VDKFHKYGIIMTEDERRRRRFSEEFRKEQVRLIETGKTTVGEVAKRYHVKTQSVKVWLIRLGKKSVPGRIMITTGKEFDRIVDLEKENRKLVELIGRQQVELVYKDGLLRLAKEKLGDDFEKK
jgi:transposase-like protein